jgi:hypothetical protein
MVSMTPAAALPAPHTTNFKSTRFDGDKPEMKIKFGIHFLFKHVAAILQHYARSLICMKHFFFIINIQKEKANSFTQSAGINMQSP